MGWLGWPPDQVLAADVNAVEMALNARVDLLGKIFGDGKSQSKKPASVTAQNFRDIARSHNDNWRRGK